MDQQVWQCKDHLLPIVNICIENHECSDRRLCHQCTYASHSNIPKQKTPLVQDLISQVLDKLNNYQQTNVTLSCQAIQILQDRAMKVLEEFNNLTKYFINTLENSNEDIKELKITLEGNQSFNLKKNDWSIIFEILQNDLLKQRQDKMEKFQQLSLDNFNKLTDIMLDSFDSFRSFLQKTDLGVLSQLLEEKCKLKLKRKTTTKDNFTTKLQGYLEEQVMKNVPKDGVWFEEIKLFSDVIFSGLYKNGIKQGNWKFSLLGKTIGQGFYDQSGMKTGNWIEPDEGYRSYFHEVIYSGEYQNGVRIGTWVTFYQEKKIGSGNYDEKGEKSGQWIELHNKFLQITSQGEYRNDLRVGTWTILNKGKKIGGGNYNEDGEKSGKWVELHEQFSSSCSVTVSGQYINDVPVGTWTTFLKKKEIGGGNYNENGEKSGKWIELHKRFADNFQVTFSSEYKNGIPVGTVIKQQQEMRQQNIESSNQERN